jgi:hypothetical protein
MEGMEMKFVVFSFKDTDKYLTEDEFSLLDDLCAKINRGRINDGKKLNNYLVINTDEEYAAVIVNVMKEHGHWGVIG